MSLAQLNWHVSFEVCKIDNTSANRNVAVSVSKMKILLSLILAVSIMFVQTGGVFAVSALQTTPPLNGTVQSITLETVSTTGTTIVIVTVMDRDQIFQTVRVDEKTAKDLGLVMFDGDGKLIINKSVLGQSIEITPEMVIPGQEEDRHPVGNALATFFSNIGDLDYDIIMLAHNDGNGFGVIAQALWLTTKLEGNTEVFQALLLAKETGDFKDFALDDGTTPKNLAELRKALFDGKKVANLGSVISNQEGGNGNDANQNQDQGNKDKNKDKEKEKNKDNKGNENGKSDEKDK